MVVKNIKIALIIILLITTFFMYSSTTYATDFGGIISGAEGFIDDANATPIQQAQIEKLSDIIYNTLLILAVVIAVIVGIILGIQFVTGSVSQKSKVKESLIPYFVGLAVIFGGLGIWKLVVTIFSSLD